MPFPTSMSAQLLRTFAASDDARAACRRKERSGTEGWKPAAYRYEWHWVTGCCAIVRQRADANSFPDAVQAAVCQHGGGGVTSLAAAAAAIPQHGAGPPLAGGYGVGFLPPPPLC